MFQVYKSSSNPSSLSGTVGGAIGSQVLSGYLGELFYHVTAAPSGVDLPVYQYRKVFIKNTYSNTSSYTRVWLDAVEHEGQIALGLSTGLNDTSSSPTGAPGGVTDWTAPTNYADGLSIGTLTSNGYTGVWIREGLSGITSPDPYATFRLYVGGIIGTV